MGAVRERRFGAAAVAVLAMVIVQVALAEVPVSRFNATDQAAAKAAVLKLADFGTGVGWKGGLDKNAKPFSSEDCPGLWEPKQADLVITGVATSEFNAPGAHAASGVQVYKTSRMARLDWDRTVVAPAALACMKKQAAADSTPSFRLVSMKRVPFPQIGQRPAFRMRIVADVTPAAGGAPVRMLIDGIAFGRGRTGISITFMFPYALRTAADAAEVRLAKTLNSRIRV